MGMPPEVGSGGVDGSDHAGPGVGRRLLDELGHRLVGGFEQLAEQGSPVPEVGAQELGQGEGPQAVADLFNHLLAQEGSENGASFGVAGRADAASLAGEGDQVLVLAGVTDHPGEAMLEISAIEKGVDESIEIAPPTAVRGLEPLLPGGLDRVVVLLDQGVERGCLRSAWPIAARAG